MLVCVPDAATLPLEPSDMGLRKYHRHSWRYTLEKEIADAGISYLSDHARHGVRVGMLGLGLLLLLLLLLLCLEAITGIMNRANHTDRD